MKITLQQVLDAGACSGQVRLFERRYGDSVHVTLRECRAAAHLFDWDWAAEALFTAPRRRAYRAARASTRRAYEAVTIKAWRVYRAAGGESIEAWRVYRAVTIKAWRAHEAARAEAFYRAATGRGRK